MCFSRTLQMQEYYHNSSCSRTVLAGESGS